jgi:hypothetical protein
MIPRTRSRKIARCLMCWARSIARLPVFGSACNAAGSSTTSRQSSSRRWRRRWPSFARREPRSWISTSATSREATSCWRSRWCWPTPTTCTRSAWKALPKRSGGTFIRAPCSARRCAATSTRQHCAGTRASSNGCGRCSARSMPSYRRPCRSARRWRRRGCTAKPGSPSSGRSPAMCPAGRSPASRRCRFPAASMARGCRSGCRLPGRGSTRRRCSGSGMRSRGSPTTICADPPPCPR